jgi:tetratricopeptide (TPR) repeat protein
VAQDSDIADDVIPGSLKRSKSYHALRGLKQKLSTVSRLWDEANYGQALAEVETLLKSLPGNPHLHVLKASLVQLQNEPKHDLDEAKQALQQAMELDRNSPAASIELGHFLDNVEDDPQAAVKAYAEGVAVARRLLIDGLIGQAKAYRQLEKKDDFLRCLLELLHLASFDSGSKRSEAEQIEELLSELDVDRVAEPSAATDRGHKAPLGR